jgi:aquaporin rerated protein, other eukaryote
LRGWAFLFVTQQLGGIVAAALVAALFTGGLNVSTTLNSMTSLGQGTIIEMLLTARLVFTIFMLGTWFSVNNQRQCDSRY